MREAKAAGDTAALHQPSLLAQLVLPEACCLPPPPERRGERPALPPDAWREWPGAGGAPRGSGSGGTGVVRRGGAAGSASASALASPHAASAAPLWVSQPRAAPPPCGAAARAGCCVSPALRCASGAPGLPCSSPAAGDSAAAMARQAAPPAERAEGKEVAAATRRRAHAPPTEACCFLPGCFRSLTTARRGSSTQHTSVGRRSDPLPICERSARAAGAGGARACTRRRRAAFRPSNALGAVSGGEGSSAPRAQHLRAAACTRTLSTSARARHSSSRRRSSGAAQRLVCA